MIWNKSSTFFRTDFFLFPWECHSWANKEENRVSPSFISREHGTLTKFCTLDSNFSSKSAGPCFSWCLEMLSERETVIWNSRSEATLHFIPASLTFPPSLTPNSTFNYIQVLFWVVKSLWSEWRGNYRILYVSNFFFFSCKNKYTNPENIYMVPMRGQNVSFLASKSFTAVVENDFCHFFWCNA